MNAKKCKLMRKAAFQIAKPGGTRYVNVGQKVWGGKTYATHRILHPECFRGVYQMIKRVEKRGY